MKATQATYRFKRLLVNQHGAPSMFDMPVIVEVTAASEAEAHEKAKSMSDPDTPYGRHWQFTPTHIIETVIDPGEWVFTKEVTSTLGASEEAAA